jgi:hypothetical protein
MIPQDLLHACAASWLSGAISLTVPPGARIPWRGELLLEREDGTRVYSVPIRTVLRTLSKVAGE